LQATGNLTAGIFYVASTDGALGIRRITTPWPIAAGKAAFSIGLYIYGSRDRDTRSTSGGVSFALKFLLNVLLSAGSIGFLVFYILHGGEMPNIGIMLTLQTFTVLYYPRGMVVLLILGTCIILAGMALFITSGALLLAKQGLDWGSVYVGVQDGCPGGVNVLSDRCAAIGPYIYSMLTDSDKFQIFGWVAGCFLGVLNISLLMGVLLSPGEHLASQDSNWALRTSDTAASLSLIFAIISQSVETASVSSQYYDCHNATILANGNWTGCVQETITFPGSSSGFWNIWVQDKLAIAQGTLAW
jgi:hypothetical protein